MISDNLGKIHENPFVAIDGREYVSLTAMSTYIYEEIVYYIRP